LVAQGTHPAMSDSDKLKKIGLSPSAVSRGSSEDRLCCGQIFDHGWNKPEELVTLGELKESEVRRLTGGLMDHPKSPTANPPPPPRLFYTAIPFLSPFPHHV